MFSCFPRSLRPVSSRNRIDEDEIGNKSEKGRVFDVTILERHPYTTQTFSPLGLDSDCPPDNNESQKYTYYLVIVAPTLSGQTASAVSDSGEKVSVSDPPDLTRVRAFAAAGDMAVTYGAGTWHAPMVVVGSRKVDFLVVQFANGVAEEDCQEVGFKEGIVVDLSKGGAKGRSKL